MMGGALGLAVLASIAAARTDAALAHGIASAAALNTGYRAALVVGAVFAAAAALIGAAFIRSSRASTTTPNEGDTPCPTT